MNDNTRGEAERSVPESRPMRKRSRSWWAWGTAAAAVLAVGLVATSGLGGDPTDEGDQVVPPESVDLQFGTPTPTPAPTPSLPLAEETPSRIAAAEPEPAESWQPGVQSRSVGIADPVGFDDGVRAEVTGLESVRGLASMPGEVAGPALRVTVQLTNSTSEPVDLSSALVQLYFGERATPGIALSGPGVAPFAGVLEPGYAMSGTYVITCPVDERELVQVTVSYAPGAGVVAFEGSAPAA